MTRVLTFTFFIFISSLVVAQEKFSVYADGGGASPVVSVNIDKRLQKTNSGFGLRAGIGMVPGQKRIIDANPHWIDSKWKFSVPVAFNYLIGNNDQPNFLELALQGTYIPKGTIVDSWSSLSIQNERIVNRFMPSAFVGYRRNPVKSGIVFRIGYNPFILDKEYISWFSASVGWKFKK